MTTKNEQLQVYTPLGRGKIVHVFPDGTVAVEFCHGGGEIFLPGQVTCVRASGVLGVHPCPSGQALIDS